MKMNSLGSSVKDEDALVRQYLMVGAIVAITVAAVGAYFSPGESSAEDTIIYVVLVASAWIAWPIALLGVAICGVFYGLTYLVM